MLKTMRQNTKIILWIILIAFVGTILFSWGMNLTGRRRGGTDVIGVVNGHKISYQQFYYAFQNLYTQAQENIDREMDVETFRQLRDETWNQLVNQILLAEEIERRDIQVTDEELITFIRTNPPAYIRNNEDLQTDGQFDYQKFAAVLADPRYDWTPLENQYRSLIPMQKLQLLIASTVRVTDAEVLEDYRAKNEKVQVRYVAFLPGEHHIDAATLTDGEIGEYFQTHQEDFRQPRRANLDYVLLEKRPSQADEENTRAELQAIRERALADEDFAELAEAFSQGPSAEEGGELGFFRRGVMDSAFEAAAFGLQVGQISEPVRSAFGWHLIKLEERRAQGRDEEVRARHILLKVYPSQETLEALVNRIKDLAEMATELGLEEAAGKFGLQIKQTGFFPESGQFVPGLGRASDASRFAFSEKLAEFGGPFENETGLYLVSIREREEAGVPPLENIRDRVAAAVVRSKQRQLAQEKALNFQAYLQESPDLEAVAQKASVAVEETEFFARQDYVTQIGRANEFVGTAFGLQSGHISDLVETNRGYYFLQVVAKEDADVELFAQQQETLKLDLLRKKQNQAYTDWFDSIRKKANIEDYRDRFFRG